MSAGDWKTLTTTNVNSRLNAGWAGVVALILVLVHAGPAVAQDPAEVQLRVAAGARTRSEAIALTSDSQLSLRIEQPPARADGPVRIYVFDQANVLQAMDDPEVATDVFRFTPQDSGTFTVVVLNASTSPVVVRLEFSRTRSGASAATSFAVMRVLYATNRVALPGAKPQFAADPADLMTYGYADVSIPREHRLGELEAPSIWRLEFRQNPNAHVVVLRTARESENAFIGRIRERVAQSPDRQALVFVHGFNQTFDNAVRRTAQLAYDLAIGGPAVTFSWPSQGLLTLLSYTKDQRNADLSGQALRDVLMRIRKAAPDVTIHVIAHSMGNRVLARALEQMGRVGPDGRALGEVAMMAPDIDAELFKQAAKQIAAHARRTTLYASSEDAALKAAQRIAGYPRAGAGGSELVVVPGIDTIDASTVETSSVGLGHSYYGDSGTILNDLFALLRGRPPAERFALAPMTGPAGRYWLFRPIAR